MTAGGLGAFGPSDEGGWVPEVQAHAEGQYVREATKHVFAGTARIASKLLPPPGWDEMPPPDISGVDGGGLSAFLGNPRSVRSGDSSLSSSPPIAGST